MVFANLIKSFKDHNDYIFQYYFIDIKKNSGKGKAIQLGLNKSKGKYVGICGQGPSDHSDFAAWLLKEGIDSISLNPDTVIETWLKLSKPSY